MDGRNGVCVCTCMYTDLVNVVILFSTMKLNRSIPILKLPWCQQLSTWANV